MTVLTLLIWLRIAVHRLVFEGPALQGSRDRYNGLFEDHAATAFQFVRQHATRCAIYKRMYGHTW